MKRPLCVFGFTMLFTLLVVSLFSNGLVLVSVSAVSIGLFAVSLIFKKIRQVVIIPTVLSGIVIACLLLMLSNSAYNHAISFKGENLEVSGKVCELPEFSKDKGRHYCIIKLSEISGEKVRGKLRISFSETYDEISHETFEIGDKVKFTANVYETGESSKSVNHYFRSQGISLGAYSVRNLTVEKPTFRGIYHYASLLRLKATDIILRHFSFDTAGLMIAVLTGDKTYVSDEFYASSRYAGIVHLMAVSGFHLSVWVFLVGRLLEDKKRKSKKPYVLMLLCVVFMMNFASFTGSVKRAGLMTVLYLLGKLSGKNADALNSLGFALTTVILLNPYAVFDVGFMLSLLSTLGILVMAFPLSDKILNKEKTLLQGTLKLKIITAVTECALVSVSASIFTLPVMSYYFGYISSVSVITNLLILPVCMPFVVLVGLFTCFSSLPIVSTVSGLMCRYMALYIIRVVNFMGTLSFAKIHLDYVFLFPFLIFGGVCVFFCLVSKKKRTKQVVSLILAIVFTVSFLTEYMLNFGSCRIVNLSDAGNCYVVSVGKRGVIVGLSGDYYIYDSILDYLERTGVTIDAIIPDENAKYLNISYAEYELGANIIAGDCRISLYGIAEIEKTGETVTVKGNGKSVLLLKEESLQETENCVIIKNVIHKGDGLILRKER